MPSSDLRTYCTPSSVSLLQQAEKIYEEFIFTEDDVRRCANVFICELKLGLEERRASVCQIPTYVTQAANGREKGIALGLDLGSTSLRVCSVEPKGDTTCRVLQSQIPVPHDIMVSKTSKALFGFMSYRIQLFLEEHHKSAVNANGMMLEQPWFALGFSFSSPAYQAGINYGILLRWTKGYDIPETVGQDVCILLQTEIDLLDLPVKVTAIVNDALGAIMSRAYTLPLGHVRPTVGAIFGTGTNGVYSQNLTETTKPMEGRVYH